MKAFAPLLLLLAGLADALAAPSPRDFAFGVPLATEGDTALFEFEVPAVAYGGATRSDFALVPRAAPAHEAPQAVALPMFPLRVAAADTDANTLALSVRRSPTGAMSIDLTTRDGVPASGDRLIGYIVDTDGMNLSLAAISLQWTALPRSVGTRIRVDDSQDLGVWHTLVADAPLIDLEYDGRRLRRDRIELPAQRARYLRLTWPADQAALQLSSVTGEFPERVAATPLQWAQAVGVAVPEHEGDYEFDLKAAYPVDLITLLLPEQNTVVPAQILVRNGVRDPWHAVASDVIYRLRQGDSEVTSPPIVVATQPARYWRLHVDPATGGLGAGLPQLRAGWQPQRMIFAGRGSGPFMLAYGSATALPAALPIRTLVPGYETATAPAIGTAVARGADVVAIGDASLLKPTIDYKRGLLWLTLALGVGVLGTMAWGLSRELRANSGAASTPSPESVRTPHDAA
jgi:Protein of unknown function (DUF3999)